MKSEKENLDLGQKLMLVQGISLIQDGLQFINWTEMPNEASYDVLNILRERFQLFRECVLEGDEDHLVIDKMRDHSENTRYSDEISRGIYDQLVEPRKLAIAKQRQDKAEKD